MEYILSSLINIVLAAVAAGMDTIGTSVLNILTMNIGSGDSMFEIIFGADTMNTFFRTFGVMSLAILILNYGWQLVKIMYSSEGGAEGPVGLTVRTIFAGVFIYTAKSVVVVAEGLFAQFYNFLLNVESLDRSGLFSNLLDSMMDVFTQNSGIGDLLLILIFILALSKQYIHYLVEVVERYVVLGVLIYTSPLPVATAGSRSTSNIFSSWVRMVVSQLFLMVCNVVFMRMFLVGFANYGNTITEMRDVLGIGSSDSTTVTLLWGLILYGVLYVGQRVDSYLGTLGLSAAQTGRGMMASISQTASSLRRTAATAIDIGKGIANYRANHRAASARQDAAYKENHQQVRRDANNSITRETMQAAADNKLDKAERSKTGGTAWANSFLAGAEGLSSNFNNSIDRASTGKVEDGGRFKMYGFADKNGNRAEYTVTPLQNIKDKDKIPTTEGKIVSSNGRDYLIQNTSKTAAGSKAANEMLYQDKAAESKLAAENFAPINGRTGAYDRITTDADGRQVYQQMLNTGLYTPNDGVPSQLTGQGEYGDSQFHKVSVPLATAQNITDGSASVINTADKSVQAITRLPEQSYAALSVKDHPTQVNAMQEAFGSQIDTTSMSNIKADTASGTIAFESNGHQYVAFSSTEQHLSQIGTEMVSGNVSHVVASNGADYTIAQIDTKSPAYQESVSSGQSITATVTENNSGVYNPAQGSIPEPPEKKKGSNEYAAPTQAVFASFKQQTLPEVSIDPFAGQQNDIGAVAFRKTGYRSSTTSSYSSSVNSSGGRDNSGRGPRGRR